LVTRDPEVVRRVFQSLPGRRATLARNGRVAAAHIASAPPAIAIVDLLLEDAHWRTLVDAVGYARTTQYLPVLLIGPGCSAALHDFGTHEVIDRCFSPAALAGVMQRLLVETHVRQESGSQSAALRSVLDIMRGQNLGLRSHAERTARYAGLLARKLELGDRLHRAIQMGAWLHDIGKTSVSHEILDKAGPLTDEEFALVKRHPEAGYAICEPVEVLAPLLDAIRYHHERIDGTGYPHRLARDHIPMSARVIAVADAYDAMTNWRVYRDPVSARRVGEVLAAGAGRQWDAEVVAAARSLIAEGTPAASETASAPPPMAGDSWVSDKHRFDCFA
jgi:HD-GYP domain-containing protein (c-di-GMP phosphodiesterase class II)